jgi:hypothetical protein
MGTIHLRVGNANINGDVAASVDAGPQVHSSASVKAYFDRLVAAEKEELLEQARLLDMLNTGRFQFYENSLTSTTLIFSIIVSILLALNSGFWDGLQEAMEHVVSPTQMDLLHEQTVAIGMENGWEMPYTKEDVKLGVKNSFGSETASSVSMEKYLRDTGKAGRLAERHRREACHRGIRRAHH